MAADRREELARAGLEHLQAAAREVIKATRSLLDAAEELVEDPAAVQEAVATLASLAQAAAGRLRSDGAGPTGSSDDPSAREDRVEHIRIS
ncbi:MAG: hypothetical protein ACLGI8_00430 [Acidimicrobiia bacterium]|jgi:hypothetical protein